MARVCWGVGGGWVAKGPKALRLIVFKQQSQIFQVASWSTSVATLYTESKHTLCLGLSNYFFTSLNVRLVADTLPTEWRSDVG